MLFGISPLLSPDLLYVLSSMGHGDEIVIADANFPGNSMNEQVIRADGLRIVPLLEAIMPLFPLDKTSKNPVIMMAPSGGDTADPLVERSYFDVISKIWPGTPAIEKEERFAFYERSKKSFAVLMTGETKTYANIILKKGVISAN